MKNRFLSLLILTLLACLPMPSLWASLALYANKQIHLSNNAIICMHQDPMGYLWVGTYDGLNLYNGKETLTYRFELNNPNSLCSNIIHKITDAEPGYLWISTSLGLNKFSLKERKVVASYPGYNECIRMATDSSGVTIAICKEERISCYTPLSDGFRDLPREGIYPQDVRALFKGADGKFHLLLASGIMKLLTPDFTSTSFELISEKQLFHSLPILYASYNKGELFFVDSDRQLYRQAEHGEQKSHLADLSQLIQQKGPITQICEFQQNVYIVFRNGYALNLNNPEQSVNTGIGIFCLLKDIRQEILWVGTDGQGIQMFYKKPELFGSILLKDLPIRVQNPIRSLFTDKKGSLWIGTKGDGIIRIQHYDLYNESQKIPAQAVTQFTTQHGLSSNRVYCIRPSAYHPILWLGSDGPGLSYLSQHDQTIQTLRSPDPRQALQFIHSICETNDSTLWLATTGLGLLRLTLGEDGNKLFIKQIEPFPLRNEKQRCQEIQAMIFDHDSTLLLGSRGGYGVIRFNIFTHEYDFLQTYNQRNSAIGDVLSVCQPNDTSLYVGASSGLTRIHGKERVVYSRQFDKRDGIANDMIHGIYEGNDNCLWLSTNKGLTKYNPRNDFFHNYNLPYFEVTEFSDDAHWRCSHSGRLFFGGINGLVWVNQASESASSYQPPLRFFELHLDQESTPLNQEDLSKGITVPAKIQSVTISFIATDYINGENYEYAYLLAGYQDKWIDLQKNNKVTFRNLPPGKYKLKVRYRNDVNDSEAKVYELPIEILPPFYKGPWAIALYLILTLLLLLLLIFQIHRQMSRKQRQLAERLQKEQKEKLYESKLNFFTLITHELCTPLTLINGASHYIQAKATTLNDKNMDKYMSLLRENVEELNDLIQEILDFRKAEDRGFSHAYLQRVSVSSLLRAQYERFYPLAEQQQIQFQIDAPLSLYWVTDAGYFKKILTNLISNAFKYTNKKGTIRVSLLQQENKLLLKVFNTGHGIAEKERQEIFDRYRILGTWDPEEHAKNTTRNGLGLYICHSLVTALGGNIEIESEVGKYAEFSVNLPAAIAEVSQMGTAGIEAIEMKNEVSSDEELPTDSEHERRPTILVIDDHKDIVWLIAETLSPHYHIQKAYQAEAALAYLQRNTPALIITDLMMPNMDGLELIAHIKGDKYTRHIPLVIVSAKISEQEQATGLNTGADAYLTKPFSPTVLRSIVNRLVANQKELKDYFHSPESAYQITEGQLMHQEDKEFMEAVTAFIQANLNKEGLGPEQIAKAMQMNTRALYRRFKKISDKTPSDFIKDYRLKHAAQLLVSTQMNVQEIIYQVGISNKSYFYREFARKYGVTPKEYRTQKAN